MTTFNKIGKSRSEPHVNSMEVGVGKNPRLSGVIQFAIWKVARLHLAAHRFAIADLAFRSDSKLIGLS